MTEERIMNLYEHSKRTPLELKAERYFILTGTHAYPRAESLIRVNAINRLIRKLEKHGSK